MLQADLTDGELTLRQKMLKEHPVVNFSKDLVDAHCYIFAKVRRARTGGGAATMPAIVVFSDRPCPPQWVLDFLCEKKSIASIKTELVPYLVYKQFSRM